MKTKLLPLLLLAVCAAVALDAGAQPGSAQDREGMDRAALLPLAEAGDAEAQRRLGECCLLGKRSCHGETGEMPIDCDEAERWLLRAAWQGDAGACSWLGRLYSLEMFDRQRAVYWYKVAACRDTVAAAQVLLRLEGLGVAGFDPASCGDGVLSLESPAPYASGDVRLRDMQDAPRSLLLELAEEGNARAQYYLGECCFHGKMSLNGNAGEADIDGQEARRWWMEAARQGHGGACIRLGELYARDAMDGDKFSKGKAIDWYLEAAITNAYDVTDELAALGVAYDPGTRSFRSLEPLYTHVPEGTLKYASRGQLLLLAEAGNARAQHWLGRCYWFGREAYHSRYYSGGRKGYHLRSGLGKGEPMQINEALACRWLTEAVERGCRDAYSDLIFFYMNKDRQKSVDLYKRWCDAIYYARGDDELLSGELPDGAVPSMEMMVKMQAKSMLGIDYDPRTGGEAAGDTACVFVEEMRKAPRAVLLPLAEAGNAWAQYVLGACYAGGKASLDGETGEMPIDCDEAGRWLLRAAERGHPAACSLLAEVCLRKDDRQQALRWLKRAADLYYYDGGKVPDSVAKGFTALGVTYDPAGE